jgi:hypothetical protein
MQTGRQQGLIFSPQHADVQLQLCNESAVHLLVSQLGITWLVSVMLLYSCLEASVNCNAALSLCMQLWKWGRCCSIKREEVGLYKDQKGLRAPLWELIPFYYAVAQVQASGL